ncbi:hypothetical protein CGSMWGv284V_03387 [Gardnerella vaginalis 284V]|nr:hypothetical protein CGSMWGv284V_03387 [Gardnerella vaginalis 284V]
MDKSQATARLLGFSKINKMLLMLLEKNNVE